jgi:hypothetical protein
VSHLVHSTHQNRSRFSSCQKYPSCQYIFNRNSVVSSSKTGKTTGGNVGKFAAGLATGDVVVFVAPVLTAVTLPVELVGTTTATNRPVVVGRTVVALAVRGDREGTDEGGTDFEFVVTALVVGTAVGNVVVVAAEDGAAVSSSLLVAAKDEGPMLLFVVVVVEWLLLGPCVGTAVGMGVSEIGFADAALNEELDPPLAFLPFRFLDATRMTVRPTAMVATRRKQATTRRFFDAPLAGAGSIFKCRTAIVLFVQVLCEKRSLWSDFVSTSFVYVARVKFKTEHFTKKNARNAQGPGPRRARKLPAILYAVQKSTSTNNTTTKYLGTNVGGIVARIWSS